MSQVPVVLWVINVSEPSKAVTYLTVHPLWSQAPPLLPVWSSFFPDCFTSASSPLTWSRCVQDQRSRYIPSLSHAKKKQEFKQWFFGWCTSCCFSGRLLRSAGFRLHDDEPHVHCTRLDERRDAEARRSLKKSPQILLHPPNGKQCSASREETLTCGETTLVSSRTQADRPPESTTGGVPVFCTHRARAEATLDSRSFALTLANCRLLQQQQY